MTEVGVWCVCGPEGQLKSVKMLGVWRQDVLATSAFLQRRELQVHGMQKSECLGWMMGVKKVE